MRRIIKGDTVVVITGKDKGKKGEVIEVSPQNDKVKVQGVAIVTHYMKARRRGEVPQMKQMESFIHACKVMFFDHATNKACRVGFMVQEGNKKVRVNVRTKQTI
jgi:large subunit ribosomal protein L24